MLRSRHHLAAILLAAGLLSAAPAAAADALGTLLDGLAPAPPQATVEVLSWVEAAGSDAELVISLTPGGAAKLVADPGVIVTPVARDGIAWTGAVPLHHAQPGRDYFAAPVVLRLPFAGGDGHPVEAGIEYAYCIVGRQCLFGEAKVSAATRPRG